MTGRDDFASYRARLAAAGFRPSSTRGQNFLLDPSLHRWIVEQAGLTAEDVVLEVGTGLGFLTRELAPRCRAVVGVEIDDRLFAIAASELQSFGNVELVLADALGGPGRGLPATVLDALARAGAGTRRWCVVANLPYAASGPLLAAVLGLDRLPDCIVVLVQRELGLRLGARPGTPDYGGLSAQLQAIYAVEYLRSVPAEVFRPRPKVGSAVVRLQLLDRPLLPAAPDRRSFQTFLRALFGQRRKSLRAMLPVAAAAIGGTVAKEWEAAVLGQRAEELRPEELVALWRSVRTA